MAKDENNILSADDFEGNLDLEIQLLYAMQGFKPVGISKHFQMACVIERLYEDSEKLVNAKAIWSHLNKLYDLQQLEEMETLPFSNSETDFSLPDSDFEQLKQIKIETVKNTPTPVVEKTSVTSVKTSSVQTPKVKQEPSTPKETPSKSQSNPTKEPKKELTTSEKSSRGTPSRRDSFSSKDSSSSGTKPSSSSSKKESNTSSTNKRDDKKKESKSRSSSSTTQKKDDDVKDSKDTKERIKEHIHAKHREESIVTKRTTRGSFRPEDTLQALPDNFKSHSPLTVSSSSSTPGAKRRRI